MSVKDHCTRARGERKSNPPKFTTPFIAMPREVCDDPSLTPSERTLLTIITGYIFSGKTECHPSTATLAEKLGRHRDHVRRLIRGLQARGYLTRRPANNRTSREFLVPWRAAPVAAPPPSISPSLLSHPALPAAPTVPMTAAEERADLVAMCQNPCPSLAALGRRRLEKFDADLAAQARPLNLPEPIPEELVPNVSEAAPREGADVVTPRAQVSSPPRAQSALRIKRSSKQKRNRNRRLGGPRAAAGPSTNPRHVRPAGRTALHRAPLTRVRCGRQRRSSRSRP